MPVAVLPPDPDFVLDSLRQLASAHFADSDPADVHIRAGALFSRLKALNRAANAAARAHKQTTADARHDMDQTHLGLQNLLYEKRHLEREIDKCRQFASIYQDISMYSVEQFMELAPPEARTQEVLSNDHQLMLNRLSFELVERQRLDRKVKELTQEKEEHLKETKTKAATMDSVKLQIDVLMKTAAEISKKVDELIPAPAPPQSEVNTPSPS